MRIHLCRIELFLDSIPHLQLPCLVVCAVATRDELLVLALEWEPRLKVILLGCGIVEGARDNCHHLIRQLQRLVEFLCNADHVVELFPRLVGFAEDKLLNLPANLHQPFALEPLIKRMDIPFRIDEL
jgi:hypothetical protein